MFRTMVVVGALAACGGSMKPAYTQQDINPCSAFVDEAKSVETLPGFTLVTTQASDRKQDINSHGGKTETVSIGERAASGRVGSKLLCSSVARWETSDKAVTCEFRQFADPAAREAWVSKNEQATASSNPNRVGKAAEGRAWFECIARDSNDHVTPAMTDFGKKFVATAK